MSNNNLSQRELTIENSVQIRALNKRMANQETAQKSMHDDIRTVLSHLESDPKTNSEGLVEKGNRHEKEIRQLNTHYKEFKIIAATISAIIGTIIGFFAWLIGK